MRNRGVRVLLLILAVAALAAAGAGVWLIEQRVAAVQVAADSFERDARHVVVSLGDWRAAQQAYVAEGQPPGVWITRAAGIGEAIGPKLSALRAAAGTAEAQGALESAIEAITALTQSDARAREYLKSGQRLSASDVIFAEAVPALERTVLVVDTARGQEQVAFAVTLERLRLREVIALASAAGVVLIALLLLMPIPRAGEQAAAGAGADEVLEVPKHGGGPHASRDFGDGVVREARPVPEDRPAPGSGAGPSGVALDAGSPPKGPDLDVVADLCSFLARVQDTRELQGLLERAAKALDASGVIVWMPDGPQGALRPVLAHGYAPLALSRMGIIHPAADNATATAYRTKSVIVVPAEAQANGAVVAPLIGSEGCSGAMAVELREGIETTPQLRAVATIVAAQLATLFTPGAVESVAQQAAAVRAAGKGAVATKP